MFTLSQIAAIIGLLMAFNVPQSTIDTVQAELQATTTQSITVTNQVAPKQDPVTTITTTPQVQDVPVASPAPQPQGSFKISAYSLVMETNQRSNVLTARSGTDDAIRFSVEVYDQNGVYQKLPVTVTTDDPDLPPEWTFNGPGQISWLEVCQNYNVNNGACPLGPVAKGTFNITFTQPDLNLSQSYQFTVN